MRIAPFVTMLTVMSAASSVVCADGDLDTSLLLSSTATSPGNNAEWHFTPYAWLLGVEGDASVRSLNVRLNDTFFDLVGDADTVFGVMGQVEYRTDFGSAFLDLTYAHLEVNDERGSVGPLDLAVSMRADIGWISGGFTLPVIDQEDNERFTLDTYVGLRVTIIEIEMDVDAAIAGIPLSGSDDDITQVWPDPFIGLRTRMKLTDNLEVSMSGDIGGFGAGSDFSWHATGLLGYSFEIGDAPATFFAGYRALSQDFNDDNFAWDVTAHGPLIGLEIRF